MAKSTAWNARDPLRRPSDQRHSETFCRTRVARKDARVGVMDREIPDSPREVDQHDQRERHPKERQRPEIGAEDRYQLGPEVGTAGRTSAIRTGIGSRAIMR